MTGVAPLRDPNLAAPLHLAPVAGNEVFGEGDEVLSEDYGSFSPDVSSADDDPDKENDPFPHVNLGSFGTEAPTPAAAVLQGKGIKPKKSAASKRGLSSAPRRKQQNEGIRRHKASEEAKGGGGSARS